MGTPRWRLQRVDTDALGSPACAGWSHDLHQSWVTSVGCHRHGERCTPVTVQGYCRGVPDRARTHIHEERKQLIKLDPADALLVCDWINQRRGEIYALIHPESVSPAPQTFVQQTRPDASTRV